eukprot:3029847-Pleurochrysis_carterae.AAC.2
MLLRALRTTKHALGRLKISRASKPRGKALCSARMPRNLTSTWPRVFDANCAPHRRSVSHCRRFNSCFECRRRFKSYDNFSIAKL